MLDNLMRRFNDWLNQRLYRNHQRKKYMGMKGGQDD